MMYNLKSFIFIWFIGFIKIKVFLECCLGNNIYRDCWKCVENFGNFGNEVVIVNNFLVGKKLGFFLDGW